MLPCYTYRFRKPKAQRLGEGQYSFKIKFGYTFRFIFRDGFSFGFKDGMDGVWMDPYFT